MSQSGLRQTVPLKTGWRFLRGDVADGMAPSLDDSGWREVRVPHDWAIEGPFDRAHDLQETQIWADGETQVREHTGRTGGLPHVGKAWYRRRFTVPEAWAGRRVYVMFDGAMSYSKVYVNGEYVGERPYGYISFYFDITDYLRVGEENLLAVSLDNPPYASRWYPGAGLYREVQLSVVHPVHVAPWGTYVTTPEITDERAKVSIRVELENASGIEQDAELRVRIVSQKGEAVAQLETPALVQTGLSTHRLEGEIARPKLWSLDSPHLYTAEIEVVAAGQSADLYTTRFGVRSIEFSRKDGFRLNGARVEFKGVCMHHDLGALGAAVNRRAIERQLEILRGMGCNAIRTSHNPPAKELLELCDEMGFLVIDEAFDEWRIGKVGNGYHKVFDEWAERDLRDMIRRDRNHPCIVMWSIGNEIPDQGHPEGAETARFLTRICHEEDPTRPVTAGFNQADDAIKNGLAGAVDIVGWNYEHHRYEARLNNHPDWIMYGSETESCVSSRGEYYLPVKDARDVQWPSLHSSAYDVEAPPWGCPPEYELLQQELHPELLGQFTWTGFDYLGEPTPHKFAWPSRSSYFGIVDLAGFPKDRYYLYKSVWTDEPVLHLFPHWNWEGYEGELIPVHCFTSFDAAELFLNGRSLGLRRKAKHPDDKDGVYDGGLGWPFTRYRLMWDVPYEPGTLEVVAYDNEGKAAMRKRVVTAGRPAKVELVPDRVVIRADGEDLSFVTVRITDVEGNLCPKAEHRLSFQVKGPGEIAALDNGDPTSLEPFQNTTRRAFNGLCLAIVRSQDGATGAIELTARGVGLETATVTIRAE